MSFQNQNYGGGSDLWIRSLPVKKLVHVIMKSLTDSANSNSLPDLQIILVGKFILSSVIDLQDFNKSCQSVNSEDFMEDIECQQYLELFDTIFHRIVNTSDSISKKEMMDMIWKHYDEGTIDFSTTSIPQLLMQSMSSNLLQEKLIDALSNQDDDKSLKYLVASCSPSPTSPNFNLIMNNLFKLFKKSCHHSKIMDFTRHFLTSIRDSYPTKYYNLFPTYLFPLLLIYDFLNFPVNILGMTKLKPTSRQKLEYFVLNTLDAIYNPLNIKKYTSYNHLDEDFISFYIASSCPRFLEVMQRTLHNGQLSFQSYPYLWTFLREKKKMNNKL